MDLDVQIGDDLYFVENVHTILDINRYILLNFHKVVSEIYVIKNSKRLKLADNTSLEKFQNYQFYCIINENFVWNKKGDRYRCPKCFNYLRLDTMTCSHTPKCRKIHSNSLRSLTLSIDNSSISPLNSDNSIKIEKTIDISEIEKNTLEENDSSSFNKTLNPNILEKNSSVTENEDGISKISLDSESTKIISLNKKNKTQEENKNTQNDNPTNNVHSKNQHISCIDAFKSYFNIKEKVKIEKNNSLETPKNILASDSETKNTHIKADTKNLSSIEKKDCHIPFKDQISHNSLDSTLQSSTIQVVSQDEKNNITEQISLLSPDSSVGLVEKIPGIIKNKKKGRRVLKKLKNSSGSTKEKIEITSLTKELKIEVLTEDKYLEITNFYDPYFRNMTKEKIYSLVNTSINIGSFMNDLLVGAITFCITSHLEIQMAYVHMLVVDIELQKKGIGSRLIHHVQDYSKNIVLWADKKLNVTKFYENRGFKYHKTLKRALTLVVGECTSAYFMYLGFDKNNEKLKITSWYKEEVKKLQTNKNSSGVKKLNKKRHRQIQI